jgi:four helix bundle protein
MISQEMNDPLDNLIFYQQSMQLYDGCWEDCEVLAQDLRGREVAKQLIRSCGSISANIEEGYGRGYGKEYPQFLRISRGSARETKGWYVRSKRILNNELIERRVNDLNGIIAMLSKTIKTLEEKNGKRN